MPKKSVNKKQPCFEMFLKLFSLLSNELEIHVVIELQETSKVVMKKSRVQTCLS